MKYIIDSHSHVQFPIYDDDREIVIARAMEAGVKMIAVGTQASTSEAGIILARQYPENIWAAVGFHPSHLSEQWHHDKNEQPQAEAEKFDIKRLRELASDSKVVAIGECGLDYYRIMNNELGIKEKQKEVFLEQANLAQELDKALMIHCRPSKGTDDAYEDLLKILEEVKFSQNVIIHFYVGSLGMTRRFLEAGFHPHTKRGVAPLAQNSDSPRYGVGVYFTFGGVVTFARDYDEVIKYIPLDRILLETDCPYVAPKSQRGKRNEPAFISETARAIAEIKNISLDSALEQIYKNTKTALKI